MIKTGGKQIKYISYGGKYIILGQLDATNNNDIVYRLPATVIGASYLNCGDGSEYSIKFNHPDAVEHTNISISCNDDSVKITDNKVFFTAAGNYELHIQYKSMIINHIVSVSHISIELS